MTRATGDDCDGEVSAAETEHSKLARSVYTQRVVGLAATVVGGGSAAVIR